MPTRPKHIPSKWAPEFILLKKITDADRQLSTWYNSIPRAYFSEQIQNEFNRREAKIRAKLAQLIEMEIYKFRHEQMCKLFHLLKKYPLPDKGLVLDLILKNFALTI
jgi:hypothetical protein